MVATERLADATAFIQHSANNAGATGQRGVPRRSASRRAPFCTANGWTSVALSDHNMWVALLRLRRVYNGLQFCIERKLATVHVILTGPLSQVPCLPPFGTTLRFSCILVSLLPKLQYGFI